MKNSEVKEVVRDKQPALSLNESCAVGNCHITHAWGSYLYSINYTTEVQLRSNNVGNCICFSRVG